MTLVSYNQLKINTSPLWHTNESPSSSNKQKMDEIPLELRRSQIVGKEKDLGLDFISS